MKRVPQEHIDFYRACCAFAQSGHSRDAASSYVEQAYLEERYLPGGDRHVEMPEPHDQPSHAQRHRQGRLTRATAKPGTQQPATRTRTTALFQMPY
jgi:hypothetical protein